MACYTTYCRKYGFLRCITKPCDNINRLLPSHHLFILTKELGKGKLMLTKELGKEGGNAFIFLPSFPLCTVNSLNPSDYHSTNTEKQLGRTMQHKAWELLQCLFKLLLLSHQLAMLEEEKLSLTQTVSGLAASKENLSKEVEELLARNQSLEKKLTASKGQVIVKLPSPLNQTDGEFFS